MPDTGAGQDDTAGSSMHHWCGGEADGSDSGTGDSVWEIRVSKDNGALEERKLVSESQESRKDLEARRLEGT